MSLVPISTRVRVLLRKHDDGLSLSEIGKHLNYAYGANLSACLRNMPDAYIDRWVPLRSTWVAVWCLQDPLPDAPKPTIRPSQWRALAGE